MRVTNNLLINKLKVNLYTGLANMDEINEQISSGRKFSKASQNTADAIKALKNRRDMSRLEQFQSNLKDAQGWLDETESILTNLKDLIGQAHDIVIQGMNGTMGPEEKQIIASSLESIQNQMLKVINSTYGGKYILGGPNTTTAPFTVVAGKLQYNGQDMDTGVFTHEEVYLDFGLGMQLDALGNALPHTVQSITVPGSLVMGSGVDGNGLSENIYNLIGQVIDKFKNNDMTDINLYAEKVDDKFKETMIQIVSVGERAKFTEFLSERYDLDHFNAIKKQSELEAVDEARAIIDYKTAEMAYRAALQMGSRIIQPSLLDFLR